jgi:hypothetical protein
MLTSPVNDAGEGLIGALKLGTNNPIFLPDGLQRHRLLLFVPHRELDSRLQLSGIDGVNLQFKLRVSLVDSLDNPVHHQRVQGSHAVFKYILDGGQLSVKPLKLAGFQVPVTGAAQCPS